MKTGKYLRAVLWLLGAGVWAIMASSYLSEGSNVFGGIQIFLCVFSIIQAVRACLKT